MASDAHCGIVASIMNRIIVQLDDDLLSSLDRAAEADGVSRAAEVREAISWAMAERRRRAELDAVVSSYRDRPPEDLTLPPEFVQAAWPD